MRKSKCRKLLCTAFLFWLLASLCVLSVHAESTGKLMLRKAEKDTAFSLYRIGTVDENGALSIAAEFTKYGISFADVKQENLDEISATLADYISQDRLRAAATGRTDEKGSLDFDELTPGLYLAVGESVRKNGTLYEQVPVMTFLPMQRKDGAMAYEITAEVKSVPATERTGISVCKIWSGDSEADRPKSVEASLLRDGRVVDTVTLSEKNDWQYLWKNLVKGRYRVIEKDVPDGYTVTVTEDSGAFTVRNTAKPGTPGEPPKGGDRIPQTGQLWWPVIILSVMGLILLLLGLYVRRRDDRTR